MSETQKLIRENFIVDEPKVRKLQKVLGILSIDEAI